jgi:hypothetical protein
MTRMLIASAVVILSVHPIAQECLVGLLIMGDTVFQIKYSVN